MGNKHSIYTDNIPYRIFYDYISLMGITIFPLSLINKKGLEYKLQCYIKNGKLTFKIINGNKYINLYYGSYYFIPSHDKDKLILRNYNNRYSIIITAVNNNQLSTTVYIDDGPLYEINFPKIDEFLIQNPIYILNG